jgi:hypothetical protein
LPRPRKALIISIILIVPLSGAILADDNSIEVVVSPNVLALNSIGGTVSLHTDISYSLVKDEDMSLTVNGEPLPIIFIFADDRGDLVVKCGIDELKEMVSEVTTATFILTIGTEGDGDKYTGTDEIRIASPKGK